MDYFKLMIKPISPFITEPVSDTLFGQICYTLSLMGENMEDILKDYDKEPFLVVSDMLPMGYALKPQEPAALSENINVNTLAGRKSEKNKNRVYIDDVIKNGKITAVHNPTWTIEHYNMTHASINRFTGTTSKGEHAPYNIIEYYYNTKNNTDFYFDLYIYVNDKYREKVIDAIKLIGKYGYGKKASLGRGLFVMQSVEDVSIDTTGKNSLFTLGNCVIYGMKNKCEELYYTPLTRFGKHGVYTAKTMPFKSPFVMASQGALFKYITDLSIFDKPFIGKIVNNISYHSNTIAQGYSLYIPITL